VFSPPEEIPIYAIGIPVSDKLFGTEDGVVAGQLSLIDFRIYSKIKTSELIGQKWSKPSQQVLARNVIDLIQRVDRVSYWTSSCVITPVKVKERIRTLSKMIYIAKCLVDKRNFNSFLGIMNGLSLAPVSRLHQTWDGLPHKIRDLYQEMCLLQNPQSSFKVLREEMKKVDQETLPYLATFLGDLTLMDENVNFIQGADGIELINMAKHIMITKAIASILRPQQFAAASFDVPQDEPLYTLLSELPGLNAQELYALSLEREPKTPQTT